SFNETGNVLSAPQEALDRLGVIAPPAREAAPDTLVSEDGVAAAGDLAVVDAEAETPVAAPTAEAAEDAAPELAQEAPAEAEAALETATDEPAEPEGESAREPESVPVAEAASEDEVDASGPEASAEPESSEPDARSEEAGEEEVTDVENDKPGVTDEESPALNTVRED